MIVGVLGCRRRGAIALLTSFVLFTASSSAASDAYQWRVAELSFHADRDYSDPFDSEDAGFRVDFTGPEGRKVTMPGFWDGGRTWRVRFTPTAPGTWSYVTHCRDKRDRGLNGRHGSVTAAPPSSETAVRRHGGFLRSSANGRYLTYADGTPFFWLGDTWWNVPSGFVSFDQFAAVVDRRASQGFSVFQAHGYTGFGSDPDRTVFDAIRDGGDAAARYWQEVDRYYAYAERRGMVAVVGFATGEVLDRVSLSDLKRLWHYYLARYSAYPITFLLTQEYNAALGDKKGRIEKMLELGRFIHDSDPYRRAFSIHPWVQTRDGHEAWNEAWYGFVLLQAGHFVTTPCDSYLRIYESKPPRPLIESEANYEGFSRKDFAVDAAVIRRSAYTAMQCGASGFTYGAQGLYAGITTKDRPATTAKWGPVLTWDEGLSLAGGVQMAYLRRLYESVEWWRLAPWPAKNVTSGALVRSVDRDTIVVYVPSAPQRRDEIRIAGFEQPASFRAEWFDPRTGDFSTVTESLSVDRETLRLPRAPSLEDWVLVARADHEVRLP